MTLDEAKQLLLNGAYFADVYELDPTVGEALREWYCTTPGLPNLEARKGIVTCSERKKTTYISDKPCHACGGEDFIPGRCPTCANCGESAGGCS